VSKKCPITSPIKISGVYPTKEISPIAVPVSSNGILRSFNTVKYNTLVLYTPIAVINTPIRNNSVVCECIMFVVNNNPPRIDNPKPMHKIFEGFDLSARKPMATPRENVCDFVTYICT